MKNAQNISCVIIDDDPFIHELLKDKLTIHFPEIRIIGVAKCGNEGIELLKETVPQLLFLDVEMYDMTGFEMLSKIPSINFKTIFITSYHHYAIKAIRFNALDYLLKPFDLQELKIAISRLKQSLNYTDKNLNLDYALKNLKLNKPSEQVLSLRTQSGDLHLKLCDILYLEGNRNYSNIRLVNNKREIVAKTLSSIEELLIENGFFRCHKSYLVHVEHIDSISDNFIILSNLDRIPISRRKHEVFKHWLKLQKTELGLA